jgi:putative ABC transport system substrate-binding protein
LLMASTLPVEAQTSTKIPRVGFLRLTRQAEEPKLGRLEEFRQGLRQLGYIEGQNITLEPRWAEDNLVQVPIMMTELVRLGVDVIVTHGPAGVRAAKEATSTIPVVIARMDDADVAGFVTTLARPGGNITGLSFQTGEVSGKLLDLLKESLPKISRVAVLSDKTGTANQLKTLQNAALSAGVQLQLAQVQSVKDFPTSFEAMVKPRAEGLVILGSPLFTNNTRQLAALATKHRMPAIYYNRRFAEAGALMAYGPDESDPSWGYRRAAVYVDKILKGTKPADLPVEQPTRFEFVINLKAAKQIGVSVPPNLLARADSVIK